MDKISMIIIIVLSIIAIGSIALVFMLIHGEKSKDRGKYTETNYIKDKEDRFKAIVNIKAKEIKLDGNDIEGFDAEEGYTAKLWPGEHLLEAIYAVQSVKGCNIVNHETKRIKSRIKFEEGCIYNIELYLYSSDDRKSFNLNENLEKIYEEEVSVIGNKMNAFVICYKDTNYKL